MILGVASHFKAGGIDKKADIQIVLLTYFEFINRLLLFGNLWLEPYFLPFVTTGSSTLASSFLGIMFVVIVLQPIVKQVGQQLEGNWWIKWTLLMTQVVGVNAGLLITSGFMGVTKLSHRFKEIPAYMNYLVLMMAMNISVSAV